MKKEYVLNKINSKEGSEILQTLIIISIIGVIGITMVWTFKNQLFGSLGGKIEDSTFDYAAQGTEKSDIVDITIYEDKQKIIYNQ